MSDAEKHYQKMTLTPIPKLILQLGIPTAISMLITSLYNMADTYFVGTIGPSAQAATVMVVAPISPNLLRIGMSRRLPDIFPRPFFPDC